MKYSLGILSVILLSVFIISCASAPGGNNTEGGGTTPSAIYVSTNGNDANDGKSPSSSMLTIQYAVSNAAVNGYSYIYVAEGYYTTNRGLLSYISNNVTNRGIRITNNDLHIIGGYSQDFSSRTAGHYSILDGLTLLPRGFLIANATNIKIDGFYLTRFNAYNDVVLSSSVPGAAIYMSNVTLSVITNTCVSNVAAWNGSVALNNSHFNQINGVFMNNNLGGGYGGGVCLINNSSSNYINAVILNNIANGGGGGIFISGPDNTISGFILSNSSGGDGGGILINSGNGNIITNALVACNYGINGGGVYLASSRNLLTGSFVSSNIANTYGGGVYISSSYNTNHSTIIGNRVTNDSYPVGGGIYINGVNTAILNADILNNIATNNGSGGGICINNGNNNIISNCLISNNMASDSDGYGGGLYLNGGSGNLVIDNLFTWNYTGNAGAGMVIDSATCRIVRNLVSSNFSEITGSGITIYGSYCQLVSNLIVSNSDCLYGALQIQSAIAVTNEFNVIKNNICAIWLNDCGSGLIIRYNMIGGMAYNSGNYGIDEGTYNSSSGHTIDGNIFATNTLHYLYNDFLGAHTVTNNSTWTNINNTNFSGAGIAANNIATNL